jgi:hypothetical protein
MSKPFPNRILIIGAKTTADLLRAGALVEHFVTVHRDVIRRGRHGAVIYAHHGGKDPAAVWHQGNQVSVKFVTEESENA